MNLYITSPGRLKRKDNTVQYIVFDVDEAFFANEEAIPLREDEVITAKKNLPVEAIDAIYLFNETRLNTKLLNFLAQKRIPLHTFDYWGHHCGTFLPHATQISGDLVIAQGRAFVDGPTRLKICQAITDAKIHNELSVLKYYRRRRSGFDDSIRRIEICRDGLEKARSPEEVMGFEGLAGRNFYSVWHLIIDQASKEFVRRYRPPDNPINAMISFLNSLLYTTCVSEIYRTALYPGISYIHAPQSRRFSLALDLSEPFKPIMVDRLVFRLFGQNILTSEHFKNHSNGVLLTEKGRKIVVKAWDEMLRTTVKYPSLKRSVSYRQLIRLDCYKLVKHLLEDRALHPYRMRY